MTYKKISTKLELRSADLPYDQIGPGLYPDETVVEVAGKTKVAVSVERHWMENGGGIGFHGYARVIEDDGSTKLIQPGDKHFEASLSYHAPPEDIKKFGADEIATDVALIILGEEPKLEREVPTDEENKVELVKVVNLPPELMMNGSIQHQLKMVQETRKTTINI